MSVSNKDIPLIRKTPVTPMLAEAFCDECGTELLHDDHDDCVLVTYPPKYLHKCPKCSKEFMLGTQYPKIVFEPTDECVKGDD